MKLPLKHVQRRFITLLEILIVIAILVGVGGIVAVNLKEALIKQRFKSEVEMVVDYLRLAQNLMLIVGKDVHVYFENNDQNSVKMSLEIAGKPLDTDKWIHLAKGSLDLKYIHFVGFHDVSAIASDSEKKIDIRFMSRGFAMSKGTMILSTAEKNMGRSLTRYIVLEGYPKHLNSQSENPAHQTREALTSDPRLTALTFKELEEQNGSSIP